MLSFCRTFDVLIADHPEGLGFLLDNGFESRSNDEECVLAAHNSSCPLVAGHINTFYPMKHRI